MKRFVILTTQRSGSTLLWRHLNNHPAIAAHGEMFLSTLDRSDSYRAFRRMSIGRLLRHYLNRRGSIHAYLAELTKPREGVSATGFKLMYNQIVPTVAEWIVEHKISVIHLVRENVLKMMLSRETAKKRKLYHSEDGRNVDGVTVLLDAAKLPGQIAEIAEEVELYRGRFDVCPYLEVHYEDMLHDLDQVVKGIHRFLDVPELTGLPVPLVKINSDSPRDIIENYDEVVASLAGSSYEWCLE